MMGKSFFTWAAVLVLGVSLVSAQNDNPPEPGAPSGISDPAASAAAAESPALSDDGYVALTRLSAEQGHAQAQYNLGECYFKGEGVAEDKALAVEWFRKAAEQGHAQAQYNLGECYFKGEGVAEDKALAVEWWRKAAEQGDAAAQYNLGECYFNGGGVEEDKALAVDWYRQAAEQGYARAQYNLGKCYVLGHGVDENAHKALYWLGLASSQGVDVPRFLFEYASACDLVLAFHEQALFFSSLSIALVLTAFAARLLFLPVNKGRKAVAEAVGGPAPDVAGGREGARYYIIRSAVCLMILIGGSFGAAAVFSRFYFAPEMASILLLIWFAYMACRRAVRACMGLFRGRSQAAAPVIPSVSTGATLEELAQVLERAILRGQVEVVRALVEQGVDIGVGGKNPAPSCSEVHYIHPLDVAMEYGQWEIAAILRAYGGEQGIPWGKRGGNGETFLTVVSCLVLLWLFVCGPSGLSLLLLPVKWSLICLCVIKIAGMTVMRVKGYIYGCAIGALTVLAVLLSLFPLGDTLGIVHENQTSDRGGDLLGYLAVSAIFGAGIGGPIGWVIQWLTVQCECLFASLTRWKCKDGK